MFKIGDKIKCTWTDGCNWYKVGDTFATRGEPFTDRSNGTTCIHVEEEESDGAYVQCDHFELMTQGKHVTIDDVDYPKPNIGDVLLITAGGRGFYGRDEGKYVEVIGFGDYFGEDGLVVKPYDCELETLKCCGQVGFRGVVGYASFGLNPTGLLKTKELEEDSLSGRKTGKIKMELVETGFPNALLALGAVMTWAEENKGYLPNDWKDIPEPLDAFLGAAARHRTKRMMGITDDEESGLPHLAHETFNVLAQLELLLTGKLCKE